MKKAICILLTALLLLTACGAPISDSAETTPSAPAPDGNTAPPTPQTTPPPTDLTLMHNGKCIYTIVRPEEPSPLLLKAMQDLHQYMKDTTGSAPAISDDWTRDGTDPDSINQYEILIGRTNRTADDGISCADSWYVGVVGTRIVVLADRDAYYPQAIEYLISLLKVTEDNMTLAISTDYICPAEQIKTSSFALRVASYNIRHGADVGLDMSVIAKDITDLNIDVVGLQEIDRLTTRVNGLDTMKALSEATGYQYYAFAPAINYKGGEYGTGVLSRYPIVSFEVTKLESGSKEQRCVGHAVIDVDGNYVDFFNTHLTHDSLELRTAQYRQLGEMLADYPDYIITGDFNTADMTEFSPLPNATLLNDGRYGTFTSSSRAIDNIVISGSWKGGETALGPVGHSDHRMLWAQLTYGE